MTTKSGGRYTVYYQEKLEQIGLTIGERENKSNIKEILNTQCCKTDNVTRMWS